MLDYILNVFVFLLEVGCCWIFVIILYFDVGKMMLMEKFLLYGGVIQMVGQVCVKGEVWCMWFDFMKMEQDCGILVFVFVMLFDFDKYWFNFVDIFGYSDFLEDIYCILIVVDVVVMVIDGVKGVESQICKLFEVCWLCDLLILIFCNKMDCESCDMFEIIDEIQENLVIDVIFVSWFIGVGCEFVGCYDIFNDCLELMDCVDWNKVVESIQIKGLDDFKLKEYVFVYLFD